MINKDDMSATMRWMDTVGFEEAINAVDLHMTDLMVCASQRALRVLAARRGHDFFTEWMKGELTMEMSDEERELLAALETMWIDGIVNGLRTHEQQQN